MYLKAGQSPDYYVILRNSLIQLYFPDIFICFCLTIVSEFLAVFYSYQIKDLINFIKDEADQDTWKGVRLIAVFFVCMLASQTFRNLYILKGTINSLKFRRTLMVSLFDKVVRLSMKSMTETNSGKLISLISSDLFAIEKGLATFPLLFAAPFINIWACYFLSLSIGIKYTLLVFACWVATMFFQYLSTELLKYYKGVESGINDERLKLVNDLVVGSRTIKCFGWENFYIDRINEIRKKQMRVVIKV